MVENKTSDKILDEAEALMQTQGFNAFSYQDLARAVGIKTSSIHYYFPAKTDLAAAIINRYTARSEGALADLAVQHPDAMTVLQAYVGLYGSLVCKGFRFCPCGMFAAEAGSLPEAVRYDLARYFRTHEDWIAVQLATGHGEGHVRADVDVRLAARQLLALLEGGMLLARVHQNAEHFTVMVENFLKSLTA